MAAITERSATAKQPLLQLGGLNHGTLSCKDITVTRRFYEEVLGFDVAQTSAVSLMIRKGSDHVYAVVEMPTAQDMDILHHNGFGVPTRADVDHCYEVLKGIKEEWNLTHVMKPHKQHGDYAMYFCDMDKNWWEIVSTEYGSYEHNFDDSEMDMTAAHHLDSFVQDWNEKKKLMHLHDPDVRKVAKSLRQS